MSKKEYLLKLVFEIIHSDLSKNHQGNLEYNIRKWTHYHLK